MRVTAVIILTSFLLAACGGGEPTTLAGKKAKLEELKTQLLTISEEIAGLETEITEMDPELRDKEKQALVSIDEVETESFSHYVEVQGIVESNQNIMVSPSTSGSITGIYVKEGQYVKRGQRLAKIDDAIMKASLDELNTQTELAQILYDKQKRLWEQEIGTEIQYLTAKNQLEGLQKRQETLKEQLALTVVSAPINGYVDEVNPKTGEMASPGMPMFRIVNGRDLSLKANLSELYISNVGRGDSVNIYFPTLNKNLKTRISAVGQSIDPNNRTFTVEVKLPNNPDFKANMFGEMAIQDKALKNQVVIPISMVQKSDESDFVYTASKDGEGKWRANRTSVATGLNYKDEIVIASGLQKGDYLITVGFQDLNDGQLLNIQSGLAER
ncbi:MAG: efflux RND transporter periplasmic adaptor subunit [Bacteroidota bacterium]